MSIMSWFRKLVGAASLSSTPLTSIDRGDAYLVCRIRRGELGSRAPVDSAINRLDDHGEPFIVVDVVSALGSRIRRRDRQRLVKRLLKAQYRNGAWAYSPRTGIDIDTTSSAIRALHRLGREISLDGLPQFFNQATGLYHTFHDAGFADAELGLQLPPHTFKKHQGSHPCVLANVYLLLHERGQLSGLSHEFLRSVQKEDGNWHSYYYPSPFYATRLFTELLISMGADYDAFMRRTLDGLLAYTASVSPTQAAEMLISLARLRERFIADRDAIDAKARPLIGEIRSAQLGDGSWPGDPIWESMMPDGSVEWAEDQYRVRSTALCIRALQLWS